MRVQISIQYKENKFLEIIVENTISEKVTKSKDKPNQICQH